MIQLKNWYKITFKKSKIFNVIMNKEFTDKELYIASKHVKNCFHLSDTPQNCKFNQS